MYVPLWDSESGLNPDVIGPRFAAGHGASSARRRLGVSAGVSNGGGDGRVIADTTSLGELAVAFRSVNGNEPGGGKGQGAEPDSGPGSAAPPGGGEAVWARSLRTGLVTADGAGGGRERFIYAEFLGWDQAGRRAPEMTLLFTRQALVSTIMGMMRGGVEVFGVSWAHMLSEEFAKAMTEDRGGGGWR